MYFLRMKLPSASLWVALMIAGIWSPSAQAGTREELVKYVPRYSHVVIGADFDMLRENEIFLSMKRQGQVWTYDEDSDLSRYFQLLGINPDKDVKGFIFSRYVNPYGSSGKIHMFSLNKDISPALEQKTATNYLDASLYRLSAESEVHAALLSPGALAIGNLNEVKAAVDVSRGKTGAITQNATLNSMYQKVPAGAGVWSVALPLTRRNAAAAKAKQSTNAVISAFQSYYWYSVPTRTTARSHFYGQTPDEKKAAFINSFMIGILMVAKIRANETLAGMLDQVDIQQNGTTVHVNAVITKELVDAYFKGELGI